MARKPKLFKPKSGEYELSDPGVEKRARFGERGGGLVYVWEERDVFAVQVAQVTRRPLLLRGPAGSGKSSLAPFVANWLKYRFYPFTVTARTQARDMMWDFDALARLNDANVSSIDPDAKARVIEPHNYITPKALWWAFDRRSARLRGATSQSDLSVDPVEDPGGAQGSQGAVVLLDEIDKADPDVPNNLLEALGSRQFTVLESRRTVEDLQQPLVVITTNDERELPRAFLRRCITLHLKEKGIDSLVDIAEHHFKSEESPSGLCAAVAERLVAFRSEAKKEGIRPPSTAEYLDALRACIDLKVHPGATGAKAERWEDLMEVGLSKRPPKRQPPASGAAGG